MKDPLLSVIIPTHNHAHFLPRTINCVRNQTFNDYEVIVVDNGSTDNTRQIIESMEWDKLRYIYQKNSGSAAGSRNTGLRLAKGKYIAFLDSDDIWYASKLAKVMDVFLSDPEIDVICNDEKLRVGDKITSYLKYGPYENSMFEKMLFFGNRLSGSATTVKRELMLKIGGFDESKKYVHVEDYDAWLSLAKLGCRFYFINEPLGEYVLHDSNLSYEIGRQMHNLRNVLLKQYMSFKDNKRPFHLYLFIRAYAITYLRQLRRYLQYLKAKYLNKYLQKSISA